MNMTQWNIEQGTWTPDQEMPTMPNIPAGSLVVIGGRAPVWAYGRAFHAVHGKASAVATMDLRLGGAVVVASHTHEWREGEVVPCQWAPEEA